MRARMTLTPAQRRSLAWAAIAVAAALLLWLLAPVLTPFIVGAVLAYALHPAVERLAARRVPRLVAVLLVEVLFGVALLAVLLLIVPIISKELPLLREQIPLLADRLNRNVAPWLAQFGVNVSLDIAGIKAFVFKYLDANLEDGLAAALGELLERTLQLAVNTLSFARVGAFALAHAGLSSAVIALAGIAGHGLGGLLVLILGNLVILILEAMVVSIQTTRLVLFEFFTRFLTGAGRVFRPLPPPPAIPQEV